MNLHALLKIRFHFVSCIHSDFFYSNSGRFRVLNHPKRWKCNYFIESVRFLMFILSDFYIDLLSAFALAIPTLKLLLFSLEIRTADFNNIDWVSVVVGLT